MGKEGPVVLISLAIIIFIPVYIHSLCSFNTHGLSETSESDNIRMHVIWTIAFLWLYYGDISHEMIFLLLVFIYSSIWTFMNGCSVIITIVVCLITNHIAEQLLYTQRIFSRYIVLYVFVLYCRSHESWIFTTINLITLIVDDDG